MCPRSRPRPGARHMVFGLPRSTAPKPKRKAKRKRAGISAVAIEGLAAGHEHASEMGVYRHAGREVNGRGVWASVGHHAAYLFYSAMGSWCVSNEADMEAGEHQGSLMVESDAKTPHAITESWSVHGIMLTCADMCMNMHMHMNAVPQPCRTYPPASCALYAPAAQGSLRRAGHCCT